METLKEPNTIERRNKLFEENQNIVQIVIYIHFRRLIGCEDVVQEGLLALWKATESYDDSKGSFFNYAYSVVRMLIMRWCKNQNKHTNIEFSNTDDIIGITAPIEEPLTEIPEVKEVLEQLGDLDRHIITARMQGFSLREIGEQTGMTGERVRQRIERLKPHFEGRFDK